MSKSRLCRYACGLACLVAVLALAACGAGPGSTKQADPVGFKAIEVKQGSTSEISLVNTFSGSDLTYKAKSDKPTVATVSVDKDKETLTVRAVGPGTAKITVTATNDHGSHDLSFNVTVPKPKPEKDDEEEEDDEEAPTVRPGAIPSASVAQGGTRTVTLSTVFDGANLSYDVSSSADTVATASESGGTLTISGVSIGSATITIVATNDAGSVTHQIAVTVTAPVTTTPTTPTPTSSTLTIELGESAKRPLSKGHTLRGPAGVDVYKSPEGETNNVWIITARKKGTHTVTVLDGNAQKVGTITVIVPNSTPVRKPLNDLPNPPTSITLKSAKDTTDDLDLETYFTDADGDTLSFILGNKDDWVLIDTKDGFLADDPSEESTDSSRVTKLRMEVLKEVKAGETFIVPVYANDSDGGESKLPVVLTFGPPDGDSIPLKKLYDAPQTDDGNLRAQNGDLVETTLKVGPRRGVEHTLTIKDAPRGSSAGFIFANTAYAELLEDDRLVPPTRADPTLYCKRGGKHYTYDCSDDPVSLPTTTGDNYFVLESSLAVEAEWGAATLGGDPSVMFTLKEQGNSGSIIVTYYVVRAKTAAAVGSSVTTSDEAAETHRRFGPKSLAVNVVTCSSPPDPINDCP